MPLLAREPICFPDDLLDSCGTALRHWWVFQTAPRSEKACARLLRNTLTPYFLPQYTRRWRKNGRAFVSEIPLFPGYIFVSGTEAARAAAFATHRIVRQTTVPDQERLDRELASISRLLGGGGSLRPEERIVPGCMVQIIEGAYAGIEGRLLGGLADDDIRVAVEIHLLGRGVSVPVERWMVKIITP